MRPLKVIFHISYHGLKSSFEKGRVTLESTLVGTTFFQSVGPLYDRVRFFKNLTYLKLRKKRISKQTTKRTPKKEKYKIGNN